MKIVFLMPLVTQSRYQKRIEALLETNRINNFKIISFERDYIPKSFKYDFISLGKVQKGNYLNRPYIYFRNIFKINRLMKDKSAIIYAFGYDMALMAVIANVFSRVERKIVYEVADIRNILFGKSILSILLRKIEAFIVKRTSLLVVTSKSFLEDYYLKILNVEPSANLVLENKILNGIPPKSFDYKKNNKLKIGYFGLLRCKRSWEFFKKLSENQQIEVIIYGFLYGLGNFIEEVKNYPNIHYKGTFDGYDDIYKIYNEVDIVWAVYPYSDQDIGNWRMARTNRFYESCYFKKPLITLKNTQDDNAVRKYNIGLSISLDNISDTLDAVNNISDKDIDNWKNNLINLPKEVYIYKSEHEDLIKSLG